MGMGTQGSRTFRHEKPGRRRLLARDEYYPIGDNDYLFTTWTGATHWTLVY
jgi:hypothetical protein